MMTSVGNLVPGMKTKQSSGHIQAEQLVSICAADSTPGRNQGILARRALDHAQAPSDAEVAKAHATDSALEYLSLIHISEPTRRS
eukprot:329097-Prymnesium_polylepis.1